MLSRLDESSAEDVSRQLERHFEQAGERAASALSNAMSRKLRDANIDDAVVDSFDKMTARAEIAGKAIGAALVGGITAATMGLTKIGEQFEGIARGIETTTTATGAALDDLKTHATNLVGTLDVAADTVGTTMGRIASQMNMTAGPALDALTGHVTELSARFKGMDADALIGGLVQMGVSGAQADQVIASLVQSAREFGGVMPQIATGLAQYGAVFQDLGINAEQSGHLIGELAKAHIPLQQAVMGLQSAQKANVDVAKNTGQPVQDFATFVARAAKTMEDANNSGNTALRDQMALLVFGQRRWVDAKIAAQDYLDTVRAGPDAFHGSIAEEDKFIEATRSLHDDFTRLKNNIALALEPVAHDWVDGLVDKLNEFGEWAKTHQEDLRNLFQGAAEIAGGVITVLEKITELLGEHPALIYAVAAAFTTWEVISGITSVLTTLTTLGEILLGTPAVAETSAAGVDAAMAEMAAGTTAATAEMDAGLATVTAELVALPAEAEVAAAGVITSMTEADAAVIALGDGMGMLAGIAEVAGAGIVAGFAPAIAALTALAALLAAAGSAGPATPGSGLPGPDSSQPTAGPGSPKDLQNRTLAGQQYAQAHGGQMPPGYTQWTEGKGPQPPGMDQYYAPPAAPGTPFFDAQGRPLNAQGQPFSGSGTTPMGPGAPGTENLPPSYAPGWKAGPGGMPVPGAPTPPTPGADGTDLTPDDFSKQGGGKGKKGKLPEAPEVPYGPGYGGPPEPGENEEHYRARMNLLDKQHELATDQARLNQLEASNVATADDIQKAKNKLLHDQVEVNEAEANVNKSQTDKLRKHSEDLGQIGAKIDDDFGISKGLPGIAENLTKFLANLAFAPAFGAMAGAQAGLGYPGKAAGSGFIGMAASAMGMAGPPQYPGQTGAGGGAAAAAFGGYPGGGGDAALLANIPAGHYGRDQGADLTKGLGDCSSAVEDLVNLIQGHSTAGASMSTANEGQWLSQHGLLPTTAAVPGTLNVGWNAEHTQATLPGGTPFNWGSEAAAQAGGRGGGGAWAPGMTQHYYLPMGGPRYATGGEIPPIPGGGYQAEENLPPFAPWDSNANMDWGGVGAQFNPRMKIDTSTTTSTGRPHMASGGEVPIMAHAGEHVLTAGDVNAMGGQSGVYNFRAGLHSFDVGGAVQHPAAPPPPPPPHPPPPPPKPAAPAPDRGPQVITPPHAPQQWHVAAPDPNQGLPPGGGAPAAIGPGALGAGPEGQGEEPSPIGQPGAPGQPAGGPQAGPSVVGGGEPLSIPGPGLGFGGGLIGLVESLPGDALSAAGGMVPGGGAGGAVASAAIQIGMQELNRAIGFGGQAVGIGVQGVMETLLPAGASKLASDNWLTRIAAGVSGAKAQLPNVAGDKKQPEDAARGLTPEQIASMGQSDTQMGGGGAPGPGGPNAPAQPLIHIENNHMTGTPDQNALALQRHQVAAAPPVGAR